MGSVTGSIATLVLVVLPFLIALPFLSWWEWPPWQVIGMALLAGALIQLSQFLYFQSLSYSEAGIVAAYWNMVPALVPIASFILLKEVLDMHVYSGIVLLILASVFFSLIDTNKKYHWHSFVLMLLAACMQAMMFLLQESIFLETSYINGFLIIAIGIVIAGFLPFFSRESRHDIISSAPKLYSFSLVFIGIEAANLIALAFSQKAVDLGIPSLVAAVESTIPAYTFLISALLCLILPMIGDCNAMKKLPQKCAGIGLMIIGVLLVS